MRLQRFNKLPFNAIKPNFVVIYVFFKQLPCLFENFFLSNRGEQEAILFLFGCLEVNITWLITSELANQWHEKYYSIVWYTCKLLSCFFFGLTEDGA